MPDTKTQWETGFATVTGPDGTFTVSKADLPNYTGRGFKVSSGKQQEEISASGFSLGDTATKVPRYGGQIEDYYSGLDTTAPTATEEETIREQKRKDVQAQIDAIPPIPTIPTSYVFASIASQIFADTTPFFPNITESVDNDNEFTANTFTAKVAGLFSAKFSGSLFFNGTTGVNQRQEIDILKNGSSISMAGWEGTESRTVDLCTTIDIELAVGETLTFSCVANSVVSYENKILEGRISITQLR